MSSWPAEWFDEIDSTNEEARRRVASGTFTNSWIAARSQTTGRGRLGRHWKSPAGNLYATALFKLDGSIADATKIPFASGLAVVDVVEVIAPDVPVKLKMAQRCAPWRRETLRYFGRSGSTSGGMLGSVRHRNERGLCSSRYGAGSDLPCRPLRKHGHNIRHRT